MTGKFFSALGLRPAAGRLIVLATTVLAVVGSYGVITYPVARRTSEIGVRGALGATRSRIMPMILGEGGRLIIAKLVVGVAAAIGSGRLATAMLFGLKPRDPVRAANLNPMAALREE